jgi:hypothetical protein
VADESLDAGQCPACGFPFDGPVLLAAPGRGGARMILAGGFVAALAGVAAGVAFWPHSDAPAQPPPAFVAATPSEPALPVAPFPHEPNPAEPQVEPNPTPDVKPEPVALPAPKREGRPVGVVMKVDPKIAPVRHFDQPDDTAALTDVNTGDRVVLTGRLRGLRVGSVNGKGSIDASRLTVEEVVIAGDINSEAVVKLNAPGGKVTVGGFVLGAPKLTVTAPAGEVLIAKSGRVSGASVLTITAKRFEALGRIAGAARVNLVLSAGGSLKLTTMDERAVVTWRKALPSHPRPVVEKGELRGGASVVQIEGR